MPAAAHEATLSRLPLPSVGRATLTLPGIPELGRDNHARDAIVEDAGWLRVALIATGSLFFFTVVVFTGVSSF